MIALAPAPRIETPDGTVHVVSRTQLAQHPAWRRAYHGQRKDSRYYEIVEDTILPKFEHRYFVLEHPTDGSFAFQPFFVIDQDLLAGTAPAAQAMIARVRRSVWSRCLMARTIMIGCAAGEGHLDDGGDERLAWVTRCLKSAVDQYARQIGAAMIVFKEFPAHYRAAMSSLTADGRYARIPSMPMVRLPIGFQSFDDYLTNVVSKATRKDLRRKFKATAAAAPIELQVVSDLTPHVEDFYPLYLQVYGRSKLHFEQLTPEYLCRLGREMPDKTRYFLWRQAGKPIAFALAMLDGKNFYDEYLGLDYAVALDLHLYFYTLRDILEWAIAHGFKSYYSSALNYEPKLHLKCELAPLDLYVRHTFAPANLVMRKILPLLGPTRGEKTLAKFSNYAALWGDA